MTILAVCKCNRGISNCCGIIIKFNIVNLGSEAKNVYDNLLEGCFGVWYLVSVHIYDKVSTKEPAKVRSIYKDASVGIC